MNVCFRSATCEDAEAIVELICLADQAHRPVPGYQLALPDPVERLEVLRKLTCTRILQPFHHSLFLVAEVDGKVVSGLSGHDPATGGMDRVGEALVEIGWSTAQIEALEERIAPVSLSLPRPEHAWVIDHVATLDGWRRRGLARELIERMVARGFALGFKTVQLDVYTGNLAAQRVYEQAGFRAVGEYTNESFAKIMGCPGITRLVRSN